MVFGLIAIICFVILIAFLIGKNIPNVCTIWMFREYSGIPVSLLVLVAFAAGIVFALLCFFVSRLKSSLSKREQTSQNKNKEVEIAGKAPKKKSLSFLKKTEKAAKNSENNSDAIMVADTTNLDKKTK